MTEKIIRGKTLRIIRGDITERDCDAIVNPANNHLRHLGGVAGALVKKGGYVIQEESDKIGYVETGQAVITSAGKLRAKHIIHAVGPRWGEGNEREKLKSALIRSLDLASDYGLKSISIPAISSGIFGVPKDLVAEVLVTTAKNYFQEKETSLELIEFCLFDEETYEIFKSKL
ncbi:MAG: macro domain-containing protein [Caldimicrobium sp.]|nr:macro domain-containing protein [Caldimicrobium sp.]MCX7612809.1 macro domain-containing protein [Caldimicrobium sp.]MDW8182913.1 macro domain-containing protein [Caldimicrobium sp.]